VPAPPRAVPRIALGSQGLEVSHLGLGCMGMSTFYGPPKPEEDMIALIRKAIDLGVTFLDTSGHVWAPYQRDSHRQGKHKLPLFVNHEHTLHYMDAATLTFPTPWAILG